jgi:hypothetical protein
MAEQPDKPARHLSRNEKIRDVLIGFLGSWAINAAIWALIGRDFEGMFIVFNIFILPGNVLLLIVMAFVRRWVALGLLAAYAANFLFALIMGLFYNGLCWIPFYIR